MSSLRILYASTSGHTEFVCETLAGFLREKAPDLTVELKRVESAKLEDLTGCDAVILASGTWNTGGIEGQPNPHMAEFLTNIGKVDLQGVRMAIIGLGDTRYHFTARVIEHLQKFRTAMGASQLLPPLTIVNEPEGQEERVRAWGEKLVAAVGLGT